MNTMEALLDASNEMMSGGRGKAPLIWPQCPPDGSSQKHVQDNGKPDSSQATDFSTLYGKSLLPDREGEETTQGFLQALVNILLAHIKTTFDRSTKVLDFHHPHQLKEGLEGFSLELPDQPENLEQLLVDCRNTLKYGVKTDSSSRSLKAMLLHNGNYPSLPMAHSVHLKEDYTSVKMLLSALKYDDYGWELSSGLDVVGLAGEWVTSVANTNMFTFEISPVFILMEEVLLKKMREKVGWAHEEGDGIFCPGGSMSNLYSILVARYRFFPKTKTKGMASAPRLALFTSEHSHYSIRKAAGVLGIGTENVFLVKCDERGKMIVSDLESSIARAKIGGWVPFYVNATAGTTVYGAFDPLPEIADVCKKHGLWMHVDAAWGGGLLLSRRHAGKLQGIERAASITWNPHKLMGVPLQCSAILLRQKGLLQDCNQLCAEYLFQPDKHYDITYDTGDKSIQCGRHVDVFKLWLMWKAKGSDGFGSQVNWCLENAEYLFDKLEKRVDFELVCKTKPEHSNVCFWYFPPSIRSMPQGPQRNSRLHEVAPKIKAAMMEDGMLLVGYQPLGEKPNFFRCVFSNPATRKEDVDFLIDGIVRLGRDL